MKNLYLLFSFILFATVNSYSQDLVYTPVNPSFGGNTYNYNWLLASAEAQNDFEEEQTFGTAGRSTNTLDQLSENLNRQIIGNITNSLYQDTFGESGLQPGNYNFGNLNVDIVPSTQGLSITIIDSNTGESTNIIVPYY